MIRFAIQEGDVTEVDSDLLILKYAQQPFGADALVQEILRSHGLLKSEMPKPGEHVLVETQGCIAPRHVMFVGTTSAWQFGYEQVEGLAHTAARILIDKLMPVQHVTTTIHGVGFGLDPIESLRNLITGVLRAGTDGKLGVLERVTVVDRREARAQMLSQHLESYLGQWKRDVALETEGEVQRGRELLTDIPPIHRIRQHQDTGHVFVAMPFADEFEDVYQFGIYGPVHRCGYLCEHVGQAAFTGDVLKRIRERIQSARFVIADLTLARPNVYLEVGFAWGCGIDVVFVAKQGEQLQFDVATFKCIFYRNITHLARELERLVRELYPNV